MVAIPVPNGNLSAEHYEDEYARDPQIDFLRNKMLVEENRQFSMDYLEPDKRSIANAIQIFFKDGTSTNKVEIHYPIGHQRRRDEGLPLLIEKFSKNLSSQFTQPKINELKKLFLNLEQLQKMPVDEFMEWFVVPPKVDTESLS